MRTNFFLAALGEILQRMDRADVEYSVCFPDMAAYRQLWEKLPLLARERTHLSALFMDASGKFTGDGAGDWGE